MPRWHSMEEHPVEVPPKFMPDTLVAQLAALNQALHDIKHALAQD